MGPESGGNGALDCARNSGPSLKSSGWKGVSGGDKQRIERSGQVPKSLSVNRRLPGNTDPVYDPGPAVHVLRHSGGQFPRCSGFCHISHGFRRSFHRLHSFCDLPVEAADDRRRGLGRRRDVEECPDREAGIDLAERRRVRQQSAARPRSLSAPASGLPAQAALWSALSRSTERLCRMIGRNDDCESFTAPNLNIAALPWHGRLNMVGRRQSFRQLSIVNSGMPKRAHAPHRLWC